MDKEETFIVDMREGEQPEASGNVQSRQEEKQTEYGQGCMLRGEEQGTENRENIRREAGAGARERERGSKENE